MSDGQQGPTKRMREERITPYQQIPESWAKAILLDQQSTKCGSRSDTSGSQSTSAEPEIPEETPAELLQVDTSQGDLLPQLASNHENLQNDERTLDDCVERS